MDQRNGVVGPAGIATVGTPRPPNWKNMVDYPNNTCICRDQIEDGHWLCMEHRRQAVETLRTNFNIDRDRNKAWLASIAPDPVKGELCTAGAGRRLERADNRKWRACRCGAEVDDYVDARIFMCMTCEGLWHPDDCPDVVVPAVISGSQRLNSTLNRPMFRLRRQKNRRKVQDDIEAVNAFNGVDT